MNILHVLSQFEVTGAETYVAALANEQSRAGHRVTIISDTFHSPLDASVLAIGESECVGIITPQTAGHALRTNFGDSGIRMPFDTGRMVEDIVRALGSQH
jgi:hypothetical protein